MRIEKRLTAFGLALTLLAISACSPAIPVATATERELCIAWRDSLASRSTKDTGQTQAEIGRSYDVQAAACPGLARY